MDAMAQPWGICQLCEGTIYGPLVHAHDETWCAGCWIEHHERDLQELFELLAPAVLGFEPCDVCELPVDPRADACHHCG